MKLCGKLLSLAAVVLAVVCSAAQAGNGKDEVNVTVNKAELSKAAVKAGDSISITFNFEAPDGPMDVANSVFVHIRNEKGDMLNQADHGPKVATDSQGWEGKIRYTIDYKVPEKFGKGKYRIVIGLYHKGGDGNWVNEKMKVGEGVVVFQDNAYTVAEFTVE